MPWNPWSVHFLFTQELPRVLLKPIPRSQLFLLRDSAPVPELVPLHICPPSLSIANANSPQTTYISLPPIHVCFLLLQVCGWIVGPSHLCFPKSFRSLSEPGMSQIQLLKMCLKGLSTNKRWQHLLVGKPMEFRDERKKKGRERESCSEKIRHVKRLFNQYCRY